MNPWIRALRNGALAALLVPAVELAVFTWQVSRLSAIAGAPDHKLSWWLTYCWALPFLAIASFLVTIILTLTVPPAVVKPWKRALLNGIVAALTLAGAYFAYFACVISLLPSWAGSYDPLDPETDWVIALFGTVPLIAVTSFFIVAILTLAGGCIKQSYDYDANHQ